MTNRRLTQLVSTALLTLVGLLAPKALHAQGPPSAVEYTTSTHSAPCGW